MTSKFILVLLVSCTLSACSSTLVKDEKPVVVTPVAAKESPCNEFKGKPVPKSFKDYDTDKNGKVSRNEYICQVSKKFVELDGDKDSYLTQAEVKPMGKGFVNSDVTGNERVSIIEFMRSAEIGFLQNDKNADDALTAAEFKKLK